MSYFCLICLTVCRTCSSTGSYVSARRRQSRSRRSESRKLSLNWKSRRRNLRSKGRRRNPNRKRRRRNRKSKGRRRNRKSKGRRRNRKRGRRWRRGGGRAGCPRRSLGCCLRERSDRSPDSPEPETIKIQLNSILYFNSHRATQFFTVYQVTYVINYFPENKFMFSSNHLTVLLTVG